MTENIYKSLFAADINEFINQKIAAGYDYANGKCALREFDEMLAEEFPEAKVITREICDRWMKMSQSKSIKSLRMKVDPVRQLAEYLNHKGGLHFVIPKGILPKERKYEAHIYTDDELIAIFTAIDETPLNCFSPTRKYVDPVLFRMLYCCGMRIGEASSLSVHDVDLKTGKITIRESKLWKARNVYMPDDLLEVCREYDFLMDQIVPDRIAFFPNRYGEALTVSTYDSYFRSIINSLTIFQDYTGNAPRIHDLRHTFITKRLNKWIRENEDIRILLPYLSEYVGHMNLESTDYYLSLVDEFYPEITRMMKTTNTNILPEVACEGYQ